MTKQATITAIGTFLPKSKIKNSEFEKTLETTDDWIKSRTGIRERRRISENLSCSDIAVLACEKAIEKSLLQKEDIDLLISTSLSPDKLCPSMASIIHGKLGLNRAAAFDVSAACAGFSFSLAVAANFISASPDKNILVVGSEAISRIVDYEDRNTCILFGDGAGAAIVQQAEEPFGITENFLATDGSKAHYIEIPAGGSAIPASYDSVKNRAHYLKMHGKEVFRFAIKAIPEAINYLVAKRNITLNDIDLIIPHQANIRIIDAAARKLNIDKEKFYTNLKYLGNTSTASIPLALGQAIKEGRIKKGSLIALIGLGAGLSWGVNLIKWSY